MPRSERPLRVLFLADHLGHAEGRIHGVTTYFLETLPAFDPGLVVPVLGILRPRHPVAERFQTAGVTLRFFGRLKWDPRAFFDLLHYAKSHQIDIFHICGVKSLLLGRLVARWQRRPVIAHFHDAIPAPHGLRTLERRLAPCTELALAVSRPIRDFAIQEFGLSPERVRVLHNGLHVERFARPKIDARQRIRQELGLAPAAPVIGVIGRVHPVKGQKLMIRALPQVLRQCPEAMLVIVGDGPDYEGCVALVKELGLGARVCFTGQRDDIPDLLAAVDLVVVPSLWAEPLGFVALEAMAAARPVVAFQTGGLPEIILDDETGYLVPPADREALARTVGKLAGQPELRQRLGANAARWARRFSIQHHVRQLEDIYASLGGGSVTSGAQA